MLPSAMTLAGLVPFLSAWIAAAFGAAADGQAVVRRMIVRDEMVIHVPINRRTHPIEWVEHKGPKCLPAAMIAGASMSGAAQIDFVLVNRRRMRAELDSDCAGLDFYGGFYVEPEDGAVCARRETLRSRAGASCRIERFHRLVPQLKR